MKKLIATLICLVVLSMTALPVAAQRRARWNNPPVYNSGYSAVYPNYDYRYGRPRTLWDTHRDKITTAGGALGGALLGGLLGGKKGAVVGAITGGAGAAIYTYKVRDRYRRF